MFSHFSTWDISQWKKYWHITSHTYVNKIQEDHILVFLSPPLSLRVRFPYHIWLCTILVLIIFVLAYLVPLFFDVTNLALPSNVHQFSIDQQREIIALSVLNHVKAKRRRRDKLIWGFVYLEKWLFSFNY